MKQFFTDSSTSARLKPGVDEISPSHATEPKLFARANHGASPPSWKDFIEGQGNLFDAVRRTISFVNPDGKQYQLNEKSATLMVRPRGWHLPEKHLLVDRQPISASLFDFGLYFLHNARELLNRGSDPYFYLPKLESHLEVRLWNDVFNFAQDALNISRGSIRATVLIETILATFEAEEILHELRERSAGCGSAPGIMPALPGSSGKCPSGTSSRSFSLCRATSALIEGCAGRTKFTASHEYVAPFD